jgi:hypothetical protein
MDSELLAEVPPTIEVQQSAEMGVCDSIGIATNPEMRQSIDPLPTQQCEDKEPELEVVGKITPSEEPLHHGDELVDLDPVADFISHLEVRFYSASLILFDIKGAAHPVCVPWPRRIAPIFSESASFFLLATEETLATAVVVLVVLCSRSIHRAFSALTPRTQLN